MSSFNTAWDTSFFGKTVAALAKLAEIIGLLLLVIMSSITMYQVIARFVFQNPTTWSEELSIVFMTWVGYLGIAIAIRERSHMTVDYFVEKFPVSIQKIIEKTNDFVMVLFHIGMVYYGFILMENAGESSLPATELPVRYVYAVLVVGGSLNTLFTFLQIVGLDKTSKVASKESHHA